MVSRLQRHSTIIPKPPLPSTALDSCWCLLRLSEGWAVSMKTDVEEEEGRIAECSGASRCLDTGLWVGLLPGAPPMHPGTVALLCKKQATPKSDPKERRDVLEGCLSRSLRVSGFLISSLTSPSSKHVWRILFLVVNEKFSLWGSEKKTNTMVPHGTSGTLRLYNKYLVKNF